MTAITMTPEQVEIAIAGHNLRTYSGWMAACEALLEEKPDWTAIKDGDIGFMVALRGSVYAVAALGPEHVYSEDDLIEPDNSSWSDLNECWDGSTPGECAATLTSPVFVTLPDDDIGTLAWIAETQDEAEADRKRYEGAGAEFVLTSNAMAPRVQYHLRLPKSRALEILGYVPDWEEWI